MDLIDREALDKTIWSKCEEIDGLMLSIINNAPTVDAEPVRHGMWEEFDCDYGDYYGTPSVGYYCSECGHAEITKYPYCNCGAKMDGEMIHCKDCVWYEPDSGICTQFEHDELFSENDGCNHGKRRSD